MGVRIYPDTVRIYLDMDGPLADYEQGVINEKSSIAELKHVKGAYLRLPVTAGAHDALAKIIGLGFEAFCLTKAPTANPHAASEKLIWAHEHLPELHDRIIISSDKGAVGRPCDILIDDHPEWANANNFCGTTLKFIPEEGWSPILAQLEALAATLQQDDYAIQALKDQGQPIQAFGLIKALFAKTLAAQLRK